MASPIELTCTWDGIQLGAVAPAAMASTVPNCLCPSPAILRLGDPDRHSVPVPPSEAEDVQSAEAGKVLHVLSWPPRFSRQ